MFSSRLFTLSVLIICTRANIQGDYCQVIKQYEQFKISLDNYLASREQLCNKQIKKDCKSIKEEFPDATDGVYRIKPQDEKPSFLAYCDMTEQGGGWLVIQRRNDGSEDFFRTWFEYMDGFGNLTEEFWLGNEKIHRLTKQGQYELRVDLKTSNGSTRFAEYSHFQVANMSEFYNLTISGYSGDASDGLGPHNNNRFSARNLDLDSDDGHCAKTYKGGWWYYSCHRSNLNGLYTETGYTGVRWGSLYGNKKTSMKIRPLQ